jgi:hypothetical protein
MSRPRDVLARGDRVCAMVISVAPAKGRVGLAQATAANADADLSSLVHPSDRDVQCVAIRYTERLAEAGAVGSVGSRGDGYDNALAKTVSGLYKSELSRRRGPWRTVQRGRAGHGPAGSTGGTTGASTARAATSRRQSSSSRTTVNLRLRLQASWPAWVLPCCWIPLVPPCSLLSSLASPRRSWHSACTCCGCITAGSR